MGAYKVLDAGGTSTMKTYKNHVVGLSVVCPFYNEGQIIEDAITTLLEKMDGLNTTWELIVVNDGSTDNSLNIATKLSKRFPRLRLVSYPFNRGRGYALRKGIAQAKGATVITTEIDLSWGDDIVERLYKTMQEHPEVDIVVASPHLRGGGYKNVPWKRAFFSRFGNLIIRALMGNTVTMNTGMTRAYRREIIQTLPLEEDGKEFHLEVILKAQALKYRIYEIPSLLEWKAYKHEGKRVHRKSSSNINRLVLTHSLFSLFSNPIRHVWGIGVVSMIISVIFLIWGIIRLMGGQVSVFVIIICLTFVIISLMFFAFGIITQQGYMIQKEMWTLKQDLLQHKHNLFEKGMIELDKHELIKE